MLGANLMVVVLLGQVQAAGASRDPAALVAQLGAARYADRQAAAEALEQIGRPALPALRTARESRDLEVRTRVWSLTQKIEGALLTQPTRIKLDFENAPLTDVTEALSLQTGFKMALYPQNLPKWKFQRVTLHGSQPVDFWKAIDQLCDAAGLQYNSSMHGYGDREPIFALTDGSLRALTPISDHGPFRVSLLGVHYERNVSFAPSGAIGRMPPPRPRPAALEPAPGEAGSPPPRPRPAAPEPTPREAGSPRRLRPITNVEFTAQLVVAAEPRLNLTYQHGSLQLIEAIDDRDNSLIPPGKSGPSVRTAAYFGMMNGPVVQLPAPLHRPSGAGDSIKKLRGIIPLTVSSRRADPLVVPLANATGKTFENPDIQLTVHEIRPMPNNSRNTLVELTLTPGDRGGSSSHNEPAGSISLFQRPFPAQLQIEAIDRGGQLIPWFQSGVDVESSRVTLTLTNLTSELKELRYYTLTSSSVDVPFEFTDIPMP